MALNLGQLIPAGLAAGVAYLMLRNGGCCGTSQRRPPDQAAGRTEPSRNTILGQPADPLRVLQVRLARGEIDVDDYERLRRRLTPVPVEAGKEPEHGMLQR